MMRFEALEIKAFPEKIETERLTLERLRPALLSTVFRTIEKNRSYLGKFMPWEAKTRTEEDMAEVLRLSDQQWDKKVTFDYGLFLKPSGKYIGNFGVHSISWENHRAELGYWVAESFQGKGYITEALLAIERVIFRQGFHRIELRCSALNERSKSVAERSGYQVEGRLRENSIEHGRYCDTILFAKLRSEWKNPN